MAIPGPPNYPPPAFWWSPRGIHPQKGDKNGQPPYHAIQLPTSKAFQDGIPKSQCTRIHRQNRRRGDVCREDHGCAQLFGCASAAHLEGWDGHHPGLDPFFNSSPWKWWIFFLGVWIRAWKKFFHPFFGGLFGLKWLKRTCPNLIQFVERAPSESAQDSRLDSEILRRQGWRHLGVTPFPPCHHLPGKREAKLDCWAKFQGTPMWLLCHLAADHMFAMAAMGWSSKIALDSKGFPCLFWLQHGRMWQSAASFYDMRPLWDLQSLWSFKQSLCC